MWCWFRILRKKFYKTHTGKVINKLLREKWIFLLWLFTVRKSFWPITFFGWTFLHFSITDWNSASNFTFYETHIEFLQKLFIHFTSISCLGRLHLKKKVQIVVPYTSSAQISPLPPVPPRSLALIAKLYLRPIN